MSYSTDSIRLNKIPFSVILCLIRFEYADSVYVDHFYRYCCYLEFTSKVSLLLVVKFCHIINQFSR